MSGEAFPGFEDLSVRIGIRNLQTGLTSRKETRDIHCVGVHNASQIRFKFFSRFHSKSLSDNPLAQVNFCLLSFHLARIAKCFSSGTAKNKLRTSALGWIVILGDDEHDERTAASRN
jgi:hypothetical protein